MQNSYSKQFPTAKESASRDPKKAAYKKQQKNSGSYNWCKDQGVVASKPEVIGAVLEYHLSIDSYDRYATIFRVQDMNFETPPFYPDSS